MSNSMCFRKGVSKLSPAGFSEGATIMLGTNERPNERGVPDLSLTSPPASADPDERERERERERDREKTRREKPAFTRTTNPKPKSRKTAKLLSQYRVKSQSQRTQSHQEGGAVVVGGKFWLSGHWGGGRSRNFFNNHHQRTRLALGTAGHPREVINHHAPLEQRQGSTQSTGSFKFKRASDSTGASSI